MPTLAVYGIIAALLFGAGAASGFKVESWRWSASDLSHVAKAAEERNAQEQKDAAASAELEQARSAVRVEIQTVTKEVRKIVDRPVYRSCALDADGLRLANRALLGSDPAGKPDPAMPVASPVR